MNTTQIFQIPVGRIHEVHKKLTQFQKRANKLGSTFTFSFADQVQTRKFSADSSNEDIGKVEMIYQFRDLSITQDVIVHEGWLPIVRVSIGSRQIESFNSLAKGINKLTDDYLYSNHCDHCKRNQIVNVAYIMQKGDELMRVGKGCMKSLAPASAVMISRSFDIMTLWANYLKEATSPIYEESGSKRWSGGGSYEGNIIYDKLKVLMAMKAALEKTGGWVTSEHGAHGGVLNKGSRTFDKLNIHDNYTIDQNYIESIEADFHKFFNSTTCMKKVTPEQFTEIETFFTAEKVRIIDIFLVKKVQDIVAREEVRMGMRGSEFAGAVGSKIKIEAELVDTKSGSGAYGVWTMYIFRDMMGNMYKKFGTVPDRFKQENGNYKFTAPVKDHEVYDEIKYTVLGGPFSKY